MRLLNGLISIRAICASETVALREKVLWPGRPEMCVLVEDDSLSHFGARRLDDDAILGIISYDPTKSSFRKLAVDPEHRRSGIATALIERCEQEAIQRGHSSIQCDARIVQSSFYQNRGMHADGEPFLKYEGGDQYIKMRKKLK